MRGFCFTLSLHEGAKGFIFSHFHMQKESCCIVHIELGNYKKEYNFNIYLAEITISPF